MVTVAQPQRGLLLAGGAEAVHGGEVDGADLALDQAQHSAGLDGRELGGVADQADVGAHVLRAGDDGGEVEGGGHAGLVDDHRVAAAQQFGLAEGVGAGVGEVLAVQPVVDRVCGRAEFLA
nr:hypothetical protein [Streptomyces sp. TLI_235]